MPTPALTANSPVAGAISWSGFNIRFGGKTRAIPAGNTTKRFTWWRWYDGRPTVIDPTAESIAAGYGRTAVINQWLTPPPEDPTALWNDYGRVNHFRNPSIRGGLTGWNLNTQSGTVNGTLTHNATGGEDADGSATLTKGTNYAFLASSVSTIPVRVDDKVTVTYRVKPSVTQVKLIFRQTGGQSYNPVMKTGLTANVWQTVTHTFTVGPNGTSVSPDIGWEGGDAASGATLEVAWGLWEKAAATDVYFDGSSQARAYWSGAVDNSTSVYPQRVFTAPGRRVLHVKVGAGGWYGDGQWVGRGWTYETIPAADATLAKAKGYDLLILDAGYGALGQAEKDLAAAAWAEGVSVLTTGNDTTSMPGLFTGVATRPSAEKTSAYNITPIGTHPIAQGWTSMVDNDNNFTLTGVHAEAVVAGEQLVGTSRLPVIVVRDNATLNAKWVHVQNYAPTHVGGFLDSLSNHFKSGWKQVSADGADAGTGALEHDDVLPALESDDLLLFINRNGLPVNVQNTSVIDGSLVVTESIVGASIAANTIDATNLKADTLTAREIKAGVITAREMSISSIGVDAIPNGELEDVDPVTKVPAGWTAGFERTGTPTYGQNTTSPLSGSSSTTVAVPASGVEGMASKAIPCAAGEDIYFGGAFSSSVAGAPITIRAYWSATPDFTRTQLIAGTPAQPTNVQVFNLDGTVQAKAANPAVGAGITALLEGWTTPAANTTYIVAGQVRVPAGARYVRWVAVAGLTTYGTAQTTTWDAFESRPVVKSTVIGDGAISTRHITVGSVTRNALDPEAVGGAQRVYDDMSYAARWRRVLGAATLTSVTVADSQSGGKVARTSASGDTRFTDDTVRLPFDPQTLYRVRARIRRTAGTGNVYVGLTAVQADGVTPLTTTGTSDSSGNQHYVAALNATPGTGWTEYVGYVKGLAASGATPTANTHRPNITDPGTMHANTRYIRPFLITGINGDGTGVFEIDLFSIEVIPTGSVGNENITTIDGGKITTNTIDVQHLKTSTLQSRTITLGADGIVAIATGGKLLMGNTTSGWIADHTGFRLYSGGILKVNMPVTGDPTFAGTVSSTAGNIGGWQIVTDSLYAGSGASRIGMHTGVGFYAGNETAGSAPFQVTPAGALRATNANITGAITATSGSLGNLDVTGTLTGGVLSGSVIQTAATGLRAELRTFAVGTTTLHGLDMYNGDNNRVGYVGIGSGGLFMYASGTNMNIGGINTIVESFGGGHIYLRPNSSSGNVAIAGHLHSESTAYNLRWRRDTQSVSWADAPIRVENFRFTDNQFSGAQSAIMLGFHVSDSVINQGIAMSMHVQADRFFTFRRNPSETAGSNQGFNPIAAESFFSTSDLSTKKDVKPMPSPMKAVVKRVQPIEYKLKGPNDAAKRGRMDDRLYRGFPADAFVDTGLACEVDGTLMLNALELVSVLWQAVRELDDEVQTLKAGSSSPLAPTRKKTAAE